MSEVLDPSSVSLREAFQGECAVLVRVHQSKGIVPATAVTQQAGTIRCVIEVGKQRVEAGHEGGEGWEEALLPVSLASFNQSIVKIQLCGGDSGAEVLGECWLALRDLPAPQGSDRGAGARMWVPLLTPASLCSGSAPPPAEIQVSASLVLPPATLDKMRGGVSFVELVRSAEDGVRRGSEVAQTPQPPQQQQLTRPPVLEQRSASAGAGSLLSSSTSLMDLSQLRGDLLNAMGRGGCTTPNKRRHSTAGTQAEGHAYFGRTLEDLKEGSRAAALAQRIKSALLMIEGHASVTLPHEGRRAIDLEWVYRELVGLLVTLDESSARNSEFWVLKDTLSFRTLVERMDGLKPSDKEWLAAEYTREHYHNSHGGPTHPQVVSQELARRVSESQLRRQSISTRGEAKCSSPLTGSCSPRRGSEVSSLASTQDLTAALSGDAPPPSPAGDDCEPCSSGGEVLEYVYVDPLDGVTRRGPFSARQMLAWLHAGLLDAHVLVQRTGPDGQASELEALSVHAEALGCRHPRSGGCQHAAHCLQHVGEVECIAAKIHSKDTASRQFTSWGFDLFQLDPPELYGLVWAMLSHLDFPDIFQFEAETVWHFMTAVEFYMSRHGNPYHNFYHAVDVAHGVFVLLCSMDGARLINELEAFTCLIAALCHDLDHPGTNNMYQVNGQTALGLLYNDQSPLENHHAAMAFRILRRPECNLLSRMTVAEQRQFRKLLINMILATDMTFHFKLKDQFDGLVMRDPTPSSSPTTPAGRADSDDPSSPASSTTTTSCALLEKDEDREILLKTILHSADLSNPAKPWPISKAWSDRVLQEFFEQGDREKREGLPISPNMNRDITDQAELSINFCDFIVAPEYAALSTMLPKASACVACIVDNRSRWEELHERRVLGMDGWDEERKREELAKWNKRKLAFEKIVGSEILQDMALLLKEGGRGSAAAPHDQPSPGRRDRRKSLRVLEELVAATASANDENQPGPSQDHEDDEDDQEEADK